MIVREVLYQLDVLALKLPLEGLFESDALSESVSNHHACAAF